MNPLAPARMSKEERRTELCRLLALGLLRFCYISRDRADPGHRARRVARQVRAHWRLLEGSIGLEAHGPAVGTCHEKIARLILQLWPELEEVAAWP